MLTKIKAFCKEPAVWELAAISLILLFSLIGLVSRPQKTQPPAQTLPTTVPTAAPTQPTAPPVSGIDVSEHQEAVDWQQVKAAGIEFVMIRVGWRGETQGELFADTLAQTHYQGAKAAGLQVGAYIFSQANTVQEAQQEAEFLLEQTKDWELDLYLALNWEHLAEENRTAAVDARLLTDITKAFCRTVEAAGKQPMVYFDAYLASTRLILEELTDYPFWLARYADQTDFAYPVKMWQYTAAGSVPGIEGPVDMNRYYDN